MALSVLAAALLPACAFWEVDAWDDRDGESDAGKRDAGGDDGGDAGDAKPDGASEAGIRTFCSDAGAEVIFCDDFDRDVDAWTNHVDCQDCKERTGPPDAGEAPSPPNVWFGSAPTDVSSPQMYRQKTFNERYTSVSGDFRGFVELTTSDGQPALQELAVSVDDANYVRLRITYFHDKLWIGTAVTSSELESPTFVAAHAIAIDVAAWHRIRYTLAFDADAKSWFYRWNVDGTDVVVKEAIQDGDKVSDEVTRVDLRSGVFYVGDAPTTGETRFRMDSVLLASP